MGIYKTYLEAVLENGSTNNICKNKITGEFCRIDDALTGMWADWNRCNPAGYLESLESFLASGKRLVKGDLYTELNGEVVKVLLEENVNTQESRDYKRFALQASTDCAETPEEKEAFDAIDMTLRQAESLSGSEKPNGAEWKNGDDCVCNSDLHGKVIGPLPSNTSGMVIEIGDGLIATLKVVNIKDLQKPETPKEREERERLEAAYDLYCEVENANSGEPYDFDLWRTLERKVEGYLAIVDKTGYRKQ